MKFYLSIFLSLFIYNFSIAQYCTSDSRFTEKKYFSISQIDSTLDLSYGNALNWQNSNEDLKLDIYYPSLNHDNLTKRPFILLIHGGSFLFGDKADWRLLCREFAKRGFVVATINYRLGYGSNDANGLNKAIYRAQQDANASLRYIVENKDLYKIDTSAILIGGGSAGAFTALNVQYLSEQEWNITTTGISSTLGSLDNSGNSFTHDFTVKGIFNNWGLTVGQFIQPSEMLPMISFHGELDDIVEIDTSINGLYGSRKIHQELINNNICSDLTVKIDGGHGIYTDYSGSQFRVGRASCFFKSIFCNNCTDFYSTNYTPANCSETNSLLEQNETKHYSIYPNPFNANLNINNLVGNESIILSNYLEQQVYVGQDISEVNTKELNKGVYFLTISSQNRKETFKLIKE
jgi:hypothetical protein